ncbi:MAG TPA: glycerophosphodiester phosphodiesterase family protein, partial [Pirellulaceae bacterium]
MPVELVAHRGLPFRFPENSWLGYRHAVAAGAKWLETDVQLTADGIPILYHDDDTARMSGRPGSLADVSISDLQKLGVFHPERFGT